MSEKNGKAFRILILIALPRLADKAAELFRRAKVPVQFQLNAHGTASNEIIDILGLGSIEKTLMISMMPRGMANRGLRRLHDELRLDTRNSGIAFTVPISGGSHLLFDMMSEIDREEGTEEAGSMSETKYSMIAVLANQGSSEDVMAAARTAGAVGGTVINSRGLMDETKMKLWGFTVLPEKEIILILTDAEQKLGIMKAINASCGPHSDASAIVLSIPVDHILGLRRFDDEII